LLHIFSELLLLVQLLSLPRTLCIKMLSFKIFIPRFNKKILYFADLTLKEGLGGEKRPKDKVKKKTWWLRGNSNVSKTQRIFYLIVFPLWYPVDTHQISRDKRRGSVSKNERVI
jgi:hypothetical protein